MNKWIKKNNWKLRRINEKEGEWIKRMENNWKGWRINENEGE